MIQIIKKGTRKIAKCQNCGCEFSYEREDVLVDPIWREKRVNCPQCNKAIKVIEQKDTAFDKESEERFTAS